MKTILFLVFSTIMAVVTGCDKDEELQTETWWINSVRVDCVGVGPMTCYQIQKGEKLGDEEWQLFYSSVKGFDYEPGNIYQIKVKVTEKEDPAPADALTKNYELEEILSKESDPSLRLTNIWKIVKVGSIENPTGFKNKEALTFEFNASNRSYVGNMGCNSVRGEITENNGEKLILGPGASTRMACPDMSSEQAITKALTDTRGYRLASNKLYLLDEAGETLIIFQAVD